VKKEISERTCRQITRLRARNFYLGLMLTPEPKRAALYAIYAWMRCADDLADDSPGPITGELRLHEFHERTTKTLDMAEPLPDEATLWPSFQATLRQYPIQRQWLEEALAGLKADQKPVPIRNRAELDRYCHQVAGTVGMICTSIWRSGAGDDESARALDLARTRGLAFQFTNILRDVRADALATPRRSYLPLDSYDSFGLTLDDVLAWRDALRCEAFMQYWINEARMLYDATRELESLIPPECRRSLETMTRLYRTLLEQIAADPAAVVRNERVRVPTIRKFGILASSLLAPRTDASPAHAPA
jgi:phytoene synthase